MFGSFSIFFQNHLFQNLMFWVVSFFVLLKLFTRTEQTGLIDIIYTSLFHIPLLLAVLINTFILIPKVLSQGKNFLYLFLLIPLFLLTYILYSFTFNTLADWVFPGYYFVAIYSPLEILGFFTIYVGITSLLQFSKSWFREAEIKQELAKAELKVLRSQINPHFLFNSLNHIYSLAVQKSPETGPAILKLSKLLRYAIRNMNEQKVPLASEISYLKEYIELYKSRFKYPDRIYFEIEEPKSDLKISPLLLIVFIENCFKHGSIKNSDEEITITINLNNSDLILNTENTIDEQRELPSESNGLGLENVKRRLNLLYPNKHTLSINNDNQVFTVKLNIKLS